MAPRSQRTILYLATVLVMGLGSTCFWWQVTYPVEPLEVRHVKAEAPDRKVVSSGEQLDFSELTEKQLQRPLYDLPAVPKKVAKAPSKVRPRPKPSLPVVLVGTVTTGSGVKAMLRHKATRTSELVGAGESLAPPNAQISVESVEQQRVVLRQASHTYILLVETPE